TPAQESNRTAFSAGLSRWTHYEKLYRKEYWDKQAKSRGFRDGYRAYLSGFMTLYHRKVLELSGTAEALVYVSDTANLITGEESISRITREKRGETLIGAILSYKNTGTYQKELAVTLSYLSSRGWLGNLRYALLPYSDPSKEWQIYSLELLSG
ncbi:MAG: hypothetical protein OEZ36_10960, partial [Spirochaetota bacterium]|nr:hypothetical protein [Spirochaetota bacterium]